MSDALRYLLELLHKGWAYTDAETLTSTVFKMRADELHDQYVVGVPTPMKRAHTTAL